MRLLDRVEVGALQVLDHRERRGGDVARRHHARRDGLELELLERAPATLTGNELEFVAHRAHDDRLEQALGADAVDEVGQLLRVEFLARLVRVGFDGGDGNFAVTGQTGRRGGRGSWSNRRSRGGRGSFGGLGRRAAGDQGAEAAAEAGRSGFGHVSCAAG